MVIQITLQNRKNEEKTKEEECMFSLYALTILALFPGLHVQD